MLKKVVEQAGYRAPTDPSFPKRFTAATAKSMSFSFKTDGLNLIDCTGGVNTNVNNDITMTISDGGIAPFVLRCGTTGLTTASTWLDGQASSVVADLSFSYGIDTGPPPAGDFVSPAKMEEVFLCKKDPLPAKQRDCVADKYVSNPIPVEIEDIVSVRVCLLLKSPLVQNEKVTKAVPDTKCSTYTDTGGVTAGAEITALDSEKYLDRKFTTTIMLRNF
jgi:hypothetical protein